MFKNILVLILFMKDITRKITLATILGSTILTGCQDKEATDGVNRIKEVIAPNASFSSSVKLSKGLGYKSVETAIIKAAKELGYSVEIRDRYDTDYKLGSIEEIENYSITEINLKQNLLNGIEIRINKDNFMAYGTNYFYINPSRLSFASHDEVKKYLEAVSKYLPK